MCYEHMAKFDHNTCILESISPLFSMYDTTQISLFNLQKQPRKARAPHIQNQH